MLLIKYPIVKSFKNILFLFNLVNYFIMQLGINIKNWHLSYNDHIYNIKRKILFVIRLK